MSYLNFDKNLLINLEQSLQKEILRTNKSGAYHNTTIIGCNTRKQHGLLVIPIPEMDDKAHILLSSLDETVIQHGAPFNLGLHEYEGGVISPNGHKYIREFNCETVPAMTYRVGGVILKKEKVFISHQNRILIKYTLLDAHSETMLRFTPFLAFRNANDLCMENGAINKETRSVANGIATCLYHGYPELYMQFSQPAEWVSNGNWYKNIVYYKDRDRGLPYKEDLWVPGYFELPISKDEPILFSASTMEENPSDFERVYEKELVTRTSRTSFYNSLKNSAMQFYLKKPEGLYLMAGYPWYNVRARDELMALPGCTLAIDRKKDFEAILNTFSVALLKYLTDGIVDKTITDIDKPDIPLWFIWAVQQFRRAYGTHECRDKFGESIEAVVSLICKGKLKNLHIQENGLVYSEGTKSPISWMSASVDGKPVIPRTGYLVEFNALWYNALCFTLSLYEDSSEKPFHVMQLQELAKRLKQSFIETFLNEHGYLYDYVDKQYTDLEVRPNMVISIALEYSPLDRRQRKKVLDLATRELLTPKGLRSLSPKSYAYRPVYIGNPYERELTVHQGPARPWLFGFYADAYLGIFGTSGTAFIERMLIGYEEEMTEGCIGSLSELYDANPPYTGRGAVSTAKNVGEILRTIKNVKELNKLHTT